MLPYQLYSMFNRHLKIFYSLLFANDEYYSIDTWQNYISDRMNENARSCKSHMPHTKLMSNHWEGVNRMKTGNLLRVEGVFFPLYIFVVSRQKSLKMSVLRYCVQGHITVLLCVVPKLFHKNREHMCICLFKCCKKTFLFIHSRTLIHNGVTSFWNEGYWNPSFCKWWEIEVWKILLFKFAHVL